MSNTRHNTLQAQYNYNISDFTVILITCMSFLPEMHHVLNGGAMLPPTGNKDNTFWVKLFYYHWIIMPLQQVN